ncbi:MAG: hypothetical protein JWM04_2469 [Verrucomicrobiales bacterium]|nr:hypothetical protein [Verrucomicrobiales bacterium]
MWNWSPSRRTSKASFPTMPLQETMYPPKGLFPPTPNLKLITVPCCYRCNNDHSSFDDQLRGILSMAKKRNAAGQWILEKKFMESTLSKGRQYDVFIPAMAGIREDPTDPDRLKVSFPAGPIEEGMVRIAKGLFTEFLPAFDYSSFNSRWRLSGTGPCSPLRYYQTEFVIPCSRCPCD